MVNKTEAAFMPLNRGGGKLHCHPHATKKLRSNNQGRIVDDRYRVLSGNRQTIRECSLGKGEGFDSFNPPPVSGSPAASPSPVLSHFPAS
jgi:hypothetical protein